MALQNYVPASFFKLDAPNALQKFIKGELAKIAACIAQLNAQTPASAVVFANAPLSPSRGQFQPFTDSTTVTWGATISGGGTHYALGQWNGTVWTVAAI